MFVPNFKILGAVVSEKSLKKEKKMVYTHTHTHTHTLLRKRRKLYIPSYFVYFILRMPGI